MGQGDVFPELVRGVPEGDPLGRKRQARALQRWRRLSLLLALAVVYLLLSGGDGDDCDDTPSVGPSPDGLTVHGCVCKRRRPTYKSCKCKSKAPSPPPPPPPLSPPSPPPPSSPRSSTAFAGGT